MWIIPIVAAAAGAWVAVTRIMAEGPKITIVFQSADGLEAGKTKIDFNGVEVGTLTEIRLSEDHSKVIATAQMESKTDHFLVDDTKFWVVRPRISGGTVTGLGTLLSGAYIGMEIGDSEKARRRFEALETAPVVKHGTAGRFFDLTTPNLGSLDDGTPIYFRRLKVGEVASYELEEDGQSFRVRAFVNAPYDQYVTPTTRFWHASGVDVSLTASGLSVKTESVVSILVGGIAFETPATGPVLPPASEGASFELFASRADAFKPAARDPHTYVVVFEQPVRGLAPGAPVDFRGITIGEVTDIQAKLTTNPLQFAVVVTLRMDAERFGVEFAAVDSGEERESLRRKAIDTMVAHGVRAQLQTGSILTGALYVAFDFFPNAAPAEVDWSKTPAQLPTIPGSLQTIEDGVASIVKKIDAMPLEEIGDDLRDAIVKLDQTLASAEGTFDNATALIAPDSVLDQQLNSALQEVGGAARSVRVLADFLERHPEALLRGKKGEPK